MGRDWKKVGNTDGRVFVSMLTNKKCMMNRKGERAAVTERDDCTGNVGGARDVTCMSALPG